MIALQSCDVLSLKNWDPKPEMVTFGVYAQEDNTFREVRIYAKELTGGSVVTFDSIVFNAHDWNGSDTTFPKGKGYGLGFFADSLLNIQNGWFEAVAVKQDFSLMKREFGKVTSGKTHTDYKITLALSGIIVEEL